METAVIAGWHLSDVTALVVDVVVLVVWSTGVGYAFHRLPADRLGRDSSITRLRPWVRGGRFWSRHLWIRRWKRWLPDAGDFFAGGFPKKRLAARDTDYLRRFVAETRRAEYVHLVVPAIGPLFFLWNPWWLAVVMNVYLLVANVPCLLIQRYNRARLLRLLSRVPMASGRAI